MSEDLPDRLKWHQLLQEDRPHSSSSTHKRRRSQKGEDQLRSERYNVHETPTMKSSGKLVKILVGTAEVPFILHQEPLIKVSEFFKSACKDHWMGPIPEDQIGTIRLQDHCPKTFQIFANFICCGSIDLPPISDAQVTASAPTMPKESGNEQRVAQIVLSSFLRQDVLVDLYMFADFIIAPTFQNHIMDCLLVEMQGCRFSYDAVGRIYDNVCDRSPLRAIYVQAMAAHVSSTLFKRIMDALPSDFIADVGLREFEMQKGIGSLVSPWVEVLTNRSAYHVHAAPATALKK